MSEGVKNENAQLFIVYGLNKSFPGYTSYTNLFNPSYESAVSGLHCQSGQDSKVAKLVLGYPSLENNTISTNQPFDIQNEETNNDIMIEGEGEEMGVDEDSDNETELSDTESNISETHTDIIRRELSGQGKNTKKHKKTKRKKINTKKSKRTRNNKRKI